MNFQNKNVQLFAFFKHSFSYDIFFKIKFILTIIVQYSNIINLVYVFHNLTKNKIFKNIVLQFKMIKTRMKSNLISYWQRKCNIILINTKFPLIEIQNVFFLFKPSILELIQKWGLSIQCHKSLKFVLEL